LVPAAAMAGLCGFATMSVELTAVRALAPHFGDSAYVWTNVIGVMLLALAVGAFFGGRLCATGRGRGALAVLFLGAACLVAAGPLLLRPLGGFLVPQDLPLDAAMPALVRGSLAATLVLFAPPTFLLGAVSPLLVTILHRGEVHVGRAVGFVSATATLGSLLGTFLTTHWLVPQVGCRTALWISAVALAVAGLLAGGRRTALGAGVVLLASVPGLGGPLKVPPQPPRQLVASVESSYQYLEVVRDPEHAGGPLLALKINEGLDSFHSAAIEGSAFTGGRYYDWHAAVPLLAGDGERPADLRALSVGDAAGTIRRIYSAVHPGSLIDGVELDPEVVALGDRHFPGDKGSGATWTVDGRVAVARGRGLWHVVHVDAYAHQIYVPAHLASREFFAAVHERLLAGGIVACNVGGLGPGDPVVQAIAATVRAVFGDARVFAIPGSRNVLLLGRKGRPLAPERLQGFRPGTERLSATDAAHWRLVIAQLAEPRRWHAVGENGTVLCDDVPVLDRLLADSYLRIVDDGRVLAIHGDEDPSAAAGDAYAAHRERAWDAVLAAAARSRAPTAYLRELCGDARWFGRRELRSAAAEYAAAMVLGPDGDAVPRLQQKQADLRTDLEALAAAEAAARRNLLVAVAAAGVLAAATLVLVRGSGRRRVDQAVA
jgi:spermidine synthase